MFVRKSHFLGFFGFLLVLQEKFNIHDIKI